MKYLVNSAEMKKADAYTIHHIGIPSMVLMERAALGVVEELTDGSFDLNKVVVVCGSGNNGGDGFAVARLLHLKKIDVSVLFAGDEQKCTVETRQQLEIVRKYNIQITSNVNFDGCTTIVDALFGIGLSKPIQGGLAAVITSMNDCGADILSVDIPSGISADTGAVMGTAIKARKTVTFAFTKLGLVLQPGAAYAGIVVCKDIGIGDEGFEGVFPNHDLDAIR